MIDRIVRGAMDGAPEAEFVTAYCRANPSEAAAFVRACASALVSAKTIKHEHIFKGEAREFLILSASNPLMRLLAVRLVEADIEADDEIRYCVPAVTWERRAAWLRSEIAR